MGNSVSPLLCATNADPYVELVSLLDRAQRNSISMSSYVSWCISLERGPGEDVFVVAYNTVLKAQPRDLPPSLTLVSAFYCAYFNRPLTGFSSVDYVAVLRDVTRGYIEPMWQVFLRDCASGEMLGGLKTRRAQDLTPGVVEG